MEGTFNFTEDKMATLPFALPKKGFKASAPSLTAISHRQISTYLESLLLKWKTTPLLQCSGRLTYQNLVDLSWTSSVKRDQISPINKQTQTTVRRHCPFQQAQPQNTRSVKIEGSPTSWTLLSLMTLLNWANKWGEGFRLWNESKQLSGADFVISLMCHSNLDACLQVLNISNHSTAG